MASQIPSRESAVWGIPAVAGGVVEVCKEGEKFVVVRELVDGERVRRSRQAMSFERAQKDATWLAEQE